MNSPISGFTHGAPDLPFVHIDSYNLEARDSEGGFVGDRASRRAFVEIFEDWRTRLRKVAEDPLGDVPTDQIPKRELDALLVDGDPEAAGLVHGVVEDFAQELAAVVRRFLRTKGWANTQRVVVGGGFRRSRIGELAIGRASVLMKADGEAIDLIPIRNHPDEAGLIGAVHLVPRWMIAGHDAMLAVDIGGSNIRVGVVLLNLAEADDLSKAAVWKSDLWRHADESPNRKKSVTRLIDMLNAQIEKAQNGKLELAPLIGVGCPGVIESDGRISRGGQNLPGGNWQGKFNLPEAIAKSIPKIGDQSTAVVLHNDAVVQGLSEAPFLRDVERWGVLTIGTGLGNARFTNREGPSDEKAPASRSKS